MWSEELSWSLTITPGEGDLQIAEEELYRLENMCLIDTDMHR